MVQSNFDFLRSEFPAFFREAFDARKYPIINSPIELQNQYTEHQAIESQKAQVQKPWKKARTCLIVCYQKHLGTNWFELEKVDNIKRYFYE